ncbi:XRE family transcriptional regulator [Puteibacter caeruleilacunae]|nr:XRE family transcriptional regulator [Puteibacter caeruleilacunae]
MAKQGTELKKTPKRISQRKHMAVTMDFYREIKELIRVSYASQRKGRISAYNAFTSHFLRDVVKGEYPNITLDYEKLVISRGELEAPKWIKTTVREDGYLIEWDTSVKDEKRLEDLLVLVGSEPPSYFAYGDFKKIKRKEGKYFYNWTDGPSEPYLEFWVGFCNLEKTLFCDSLYAQRKSDKVFAKPYDPNASEDTSLKEEVFKPKLILQEIIEQRKQQGISQEQLAKMLRVGRKQINKIETGAQKLTVSMLYRILVALNVEMKFTMKKKGSNAVKKINGKKK